MDDTSPHSVTSGANGFPDGKFEFSQNFNPLLTPADTFSLPLPNTIFIIRLGLHDISCDRQDLFVPNLQTLPVASP
jgi:hypothetical protein